MAVKYTVNDVEWANGIAERHAVAYAIEGATGFTTGIGNFGPVSVPALSDALAAGEWSRSKETRYELVPFEDSRAEADGGPDFGAAKNVPAV